MFTFVVTLTIAFLILFLLLYYTLRNGISPMPTSEKVRKELMRLLPELSNGLIVDLGSGWGNLVFPIAKKYQNCRVVGVENSPIPYLFSMLLNHTQNLKIQRANFYETPLHDANLVICYLYPKGMTRLKEKFEKELKSGAHVLSHTFAVSGWNPKTIIEVDDIHRSKIYLYEVP